MPQLSLNLPWYIRHQGRHRSLRVELFAYIAGFAVFLTGCEKRPPSTPARQFSLPVSTLEKVTFTNASIEGKPIQYILDTGSSVSWLSESSAKTLGVPIQQASANQEHKEETKPVSLRMANRTVTFPLPVMPGPTDGILGWPAVQNDILVFNGTNHVITSSEQLPITTAGWLKMSVHRGIILTLVVPGLGDKTNLVLIDTGSGLGVGLRPPQWNAWRAAHPDLPSSTVTYAISGTHPVTSNVVWARQFELGPITLYDVPVYEETSPAISGWDEMAASFGLLALDRLNLIVDGKNDTAFLLPRPALGPFDEDTTVNAQNMPVQAATALRPWSAGQDLQVDMNTLSNTPQKSPSSNETLKK